jgi:hypothetical protein
MGSQAGRGFEGLLERALSHYGNVQPRIGLEGRVLRNLAGARSPMRPSWSWVFAGATAILIASVWLGARYHSMSTIGNGRATTASSKPAPEPSAATLSPPSPLKPRRSKPGQVLPADSRRTEARPQEPRRDQFPSPRALSRQELAFARYADQFPDEVVLIAREQQRFDEEVQRAQSEVDARASFP